MAQNSPPVADTRSHDISTVPAGPKAEPRSQPGGKQTQAPVQCEDSTADPGQDNRPPDRSSLAPVTERRAQRIHELLEEALQSSDPLAANLGVMNADLVEFAHRLRNGMLAATDGSRLIMGRREAQNLELYLRVVRQAERLARVQQTRRARGNRGPWDSENDSL
jgi:hypothetical protein